MRKIVTNLVSVLGGEMLLRVGNFAVVVVIARLYGPEVLGSFASALAAATVVLMFAINGLQTTAILETGKKGADISEVVSRLFGALTLLLAPAAAGVALFGWALATSAVTHFIVGAVALRTLGQFYCQVQIAVLKSLDRMRAVGWNQGAHFAVMLGVVFAAFRYRWPVEWLLTGLVAAQLLEFLLSTIVLGRAGVRLKLVSLGACARQAMSSTPVGLTHALANLIVRSDVLLLALLMNPRVTGEFAAAHSLLVLVYLASWISGSVLLPEMVRMLDSNGDLRTYLTKWSRLILTFSVPATLLAAWLAPAILVGLYGEGFAATARIASVLLLASPLVFLNSLYTHHAIAAGWVRVYLGCHIATAALAFSLDFVLGLAYGAWGIAGAVLIREGSLLMMLRLKEPVLQPRSVSHTAD